MQTPALPGSLVDWPDLRSQTVAHRRTITFTETIDPFSRTSAAPVEEHHHHGDGDSMRNVELEQALEHNMTFDFFLDGVKYDPDVTNTTVTVGTTEEWELVNNTVTDHPFHIHTNPFQIVARNGEPVDAPSMADVGILPKNESLTFLISFDDYDGRTLYHCHNLFHEDQGMMAVIEITSPDAG